MALQICSINSGSNGNCYYVGNNDDAVLIDVGISSRETEKRMKLAGLDIKKLRAIFVSHEHGDHIKGVSVLANRHNLPVYITELTARRGPILIGHLAKRFSAGENIELGSISVKAFSKNHDADDPHSFVVSHASVHVGVITDIGCACNNVVEHFKYCHAVFLESNYDDDMLQNGRYPIHLKRRISSDVGHLSNQQALDLFLRHRSPHLSHLILSHLSKENNDPSLVQQLFMKHANGVEVQVASRYSASAVYNIVGCTQIYPEPVKRLAPSQLALWS